MKRRQFLQAAGAGVAGAAVAAPAIAQPAPEIRWRCTSSFPKSLDTIFGAAEDFAKAVAALTDGKFQIQVFAANEIAPGLQALDAVQAGTVEMCHTASYYYVGKDPCFAFGSAIPFGLNSRMNAAWVLAGGGLELLNAFYAKYGVIMLPGGNTGTQMGGWFRKEINSVADLSGLKMRIAGIAGQILQRLGVVPQQIAGGDIYPALEKGAIDAAEWVGPYDDEKLGFVRVAKYYYYPGWWEGCASLNFFISEEKFAGLPPACREAVRVAALMANQQMQASYDARNPGAIKRLVAAGAQLRPFPQPVLEACYKVSNELYDELSAKNPEFGKLYDAMKSFRNDEYLWWQVAEYSYDNFMIRARARGQ
ncbi:TRAP transporter substrate-binding protein [Camelimonas abortus]|uniref:TRAP transporter substrate-binding protein n=1 Tax=Camelimonas abortus TaxID=1017184 RepID=A0ABV7LB50_9HYPH